MSARVNNLFQLRPRRISLSSGTPVFRNVRTYASKEVITTDKAPAALGPYSQAIKTNQTLYVSGCLGLIPGTKDMKGPTAPEQAEQALDNMGAVLEAGGASYSSVVKTLVLLDDMDDFAAVNEVYSKYFPENPPARSCFAVKTLPLGAKVKIECIAEV